MVNTGLRRRAEAGWRGQTIAPTAPTAIFADVTARPDTGEERHIKARSIGPRRWTR